ncbi:MAG: D-alanyl-D-alanine carboxypeptidase [Candidatus Melainabacteria bacterium]|nr:D-alanyl-D-alanine carboxypeptidase [Candidatus Melainabacteria bacterium]
MQNSKRISQHLLMRVPGWRRFFLRNCCRYVAVFVALTFTWTAGVADTFATESNNMANLTVSANADKERPVRESQGYLVEELDGRIIDEQNPDIAFNPASAVKILTAYATLKQFGPDFKFETRVLLDGATEGSSFRGDIFFEGCDPFFNLASLRMVFAEFRKHGITTVDASLFVSPDFKFAGIAPGQKSANALKGLFGGGKKRRVRTLRTERVAVKLKSAQVKAAPLQAVRLTEIQSETILALLKDMLSRSDNDMAAFFGNLAGGTQAVAKTCRADFAISSDELTIATSSGLQVNRVTPRAMIAALRGFKQLLSKFKLDLDDALPIAGTDHGTIYKRFADSRLKGVLVGKTGTLKQTDNGASVLVGEVSTLLRGPVLFVIFQRGRNTNELRLSQNTFLEELLAELGGPGVKYGV